MLFKMITKLKCRRGIDSGKHQSVSLAFGNASRKKGPLHVRTSFGARRNLACVYWRVYHTNVLSKVHAEEHGYLRPSRFYHFSFQPKSCKIDGHAYLIWYFNDWSIAFKRSWLPCNKRVHAINFAISSVQSHLD
jgi:hypothetical protein